MRLNYTIVCVLLGLAVGWLPKLFHGPIPYKFDVHGLRGAIAVWDWYLARLLIGFFIGITIWPPRWWLRGPLIGLLMLLPPGMIALSNPECGGPCMFWNEVTGAVAGLIIAGLAYAVTRRHHVSAASS